MKQGFELIHKRFKTLLEKNGLREMEDEKGSVFNTEFHEAIGQVPVEEEELKGKIYDIVDKGYYLNDKVIRFARVVTGS
jgi:molecular chaperone GrpE